MESEYKATVVLAVPKVELYYNIGDKTTLIHAAPMHLLYLLNFNSFLIQIKDFNYALAKEIPVLGAPAKKGEAYPSYVFPYLDGYYIIKILEVTTVETLSNLETVFSNHCDLAYQREEEVEVEIAGGKEEEFKSVERGGQLIEVKSGDVPKEEAKKASINKTEVASNIISKGGEIARTGLIKSAEVLSIGITKIGGWVQKKYVKKSEPTDVTESTMAKLKIANTATDAVFTFTKAKAQAIVAIASEIGKEAAKRAEKTETGQKFANFKHKETIVQIGKSTVHAVACLYDGMSEALTVVARGIGNTTTKIIDYKYGEKAGKATKEGLDAIGNVGQIFKVSDDEIVKHIADKTAPNKKVQVQGI